MQKITIVLASVLMLSFGASSAIAQDETPQPGWDFGWDEEYEEVSWLLDNGGGASVEFWIDNRDPLPLDLNIEWEADFGADLDLSESVNVGAQSNKSFTLEISNVTLLDYLANSTGNLRITATRASPIDGSDLTLDAKVLEGEFTIPRIANLDVELIFLGYPVSAGTTSQMEVVITNNGNMKDKVVSPTLVAQGCPQLSLSGLDDLENTVVDSVHDGTEINTVTAEVSLSPASSHPSKECTIELAIVSDGGGGTSITTQFVDIEAVSDSSGDGSSSSGGDGDNSSNPQNGGDSPGSFIDETMPASSLLATTLVIGLVAVLPRKKR
nr:hypothetical protein [Euryarchaeota archaeon]